MYRARLPTSSHRYYPNTRVIYTHRYIWTLYCCQTNNGPARWQPMLTLPSKDCGSSQRVATASSVGVRSLAQLSCGTLYRRQPRSGRAKKPSSYWGMTSCPVRTLLRAHTGHSGQHRAISVRQPYVFRHSELQGRQLSSQECLSPWISRSHGAQFSVTRSSHQTVTLSWTKHARQRWSTPCHKVEFYPFYIRKLMSYDWHKCLTLW